VSNFLDVQIVVVQWLSNGPVFRDHEPQEKKGWAANKTVAPAWSSIEDAVWIVFVFSPLQLAKTSENSVLVSGCLVDGFHGLVDALAESFSTSWVLLRLRLGC
jgi:hypothetical protein